MPHWVSLRPEALRFAEEAPADWHRLSATVGRLEMLGPLTRLDLTLDNGTPIRMATLDAPQRVLAAVEHRLACFRHGADDGRSVTFSVPHQQRLPLAIAAFGLLFLGIFLLYPLFNVFGASNARRRGPVLHPRELRQDVEPAVLSRRDRQHAGHRRGGDDDHDLARRTARLRSGAAADFLGKAAIVALAAMPLVLPSFVSAYAIVLLLGNSGIVYPGAAGDRPEYRVDRWSGGALSRSDVTGFCSIPGPVPFAPGDADRR